MPYSEANVVLIVEDDDGIRQVMEQALEEWLNVDTVLAADGLEAIEVVWSIHPILVVLDLKMPEFSGFEVLRELKARAETQDIPVIVVTALPMGCEEIMAAGADACISKPFSLETFAELVRQHLPERLLSERESGSSQA